MAKGCLATVIQTERNKEKKKKSQRSPVWLCCEHRAGFKGT